MFTHHENTAREICGAYRWRSFAPDDLSLTDGTAEEAAAAMGLPVEEVERAVEEYGRCDNGFYHESPNEDPEGMACWQPGEPAGEWGEQINGGWEWPAAEAPAPEEGDGKAPTKD